MDNLKGGQQGNTVAYTEQFRVIVEDGDEPATIINSNLSTIPKENDPHPIDPVAVVKTVKINPTEARTVYILEVKYDNAATGSSPGGGGGSNLEVINIAGGTWTEEYTPEFDINNKQYRNTAGDAIEARAVRHHPQFRVITRSQELNINRYMQLVDSVNDANVSWLDLNFSNKILKFANFDYKSLDNGYWEYTFDFHARLIPKPASSNSERIENAANRTGGWINYILNAGYRQKINGKLSRIFLKDDEGKATTTPPSSPWPLNDAGEAIEPEDDGQFSSRVWLPFEQNTTADFGVFDFDFEPLVTRQIAQALGL